MAFKLGDRSKQSPKDFKLSFCGDKDDRVGGVNIIRTDQLPEDTLGEANMDGNIYVSDKIEKGTELYDTVIAHEMKHMTDIKLGKFAYTENCVRYDGVEYLRKNGKILYQGKWYEEGHPHLPWEHR